MTSSFRVRLVTKRWLKIQQTQQRETMPQSHGGPARIPGDACKECGSPFAVGDIAVSRRNRNAVRCAERAVRLNICTRRDIEEAAAQ